MTINDIAERAYKHAESKGFYGEDSTRAIHEKLNEEVYEFKRAPICDPTCIDGVHGLIDKDYVDRKSWEVSFNALIKNTTGDELADVIITALAGAKKLGIDIEKHVECKLRYNELREDHK